MKMFVVYSVTGRLRYIGHLDLMRAMQRALRRSGLPVRYSQGYNPHILLSLAAPLPVGMEGLREVMEVPFEGSVSESEFVARLNAALPPLIRCLGARAVDDSHPAPMALLGAAVYRVEPQESAGQLFEALPAMLSRDSLPALKKSKRGMVEVDLRPLIYNAFVRDGSLKALLALAEAGTCKPELFMKALSEQAGLEAPAPFRCVREALYTASFAPLEEA